MLHSAVGIIMPMTDCIDAFTATERAAHEGSFGNNALPVPSDAQCRAGNYKKGRVLVCGFPVVIEQPRGSYRSGIDGKSGKPWHCQMMAHYGYFAEATGADGDGLDCFIGGYHASEQVFVINQNRRDGAFDEHKVMLAFPDADTARNAYLGSYEPGWRGLGSLVPMTLSQFNFWLKYGDKRKPVVPSILPYEGQATMKMRWDENGNPVGQTLDQVLYDIRRDDSGDGLIFDSLSVSDIEEEADDEPIMDALVTPFGKLGRKVDLLKNVMERAGQNLKPVASQITSPFKQRGVAQVAVIFELSDGQTVSIFFHNPDTTPNKISPTDELISWKWLLNKKDITIVVAPERGEDLNVREVARRIMKLAEKNSAAFQRANAKRTENMQAIKGLQDEISALEKELTAAQKDLAVAEFEAEERKIAAAGKPEPEPGKADPEKPTDGSIAGTVDMVYRDDGIFTSFIPMSKSGEDAFRVMSEQTEGTGRVLSIHAASVIEQLRQSGHTVKKAGKSDSAAGDMSDADLLAELMQGEPTATAFDAEKQYPRVLARYLTESGKEGAVIKQNGEASYSYVGEWGAGSGKSLSDIINALTLRKHRGATLAEGEDIAGLIAKNTTPSTEEGKEFAGVSKQFSSYLDEVNGDHFEAARAFFKSELQEKFVKTVIGPVWMLGSSWQKMKGGGKTILRSSLIPFVPEILTTGLHKDREELHKARSGPYIAFHPFVKDVDVGGRTVTAMVKVGEREDGKYQFVAYSLSATDPSQKETAPVMDAVDSGAVFRGSGVPSEPTAKPESTSAPLLTVEPSMEQNTDSVNHKAEGDGWNIIILKVIDKATGQRMTDLEDVTEPPPVTEPETPDTNNVADQAFLTSITDRSLPVSEIISGETSARLREIQDKYRDDAVMAGLVRSAVVARARAALDATQAFAG